MKSFNKLFWSVWIVIGFLVLLFIAKTFQNKNVVEDLPLTFEQGKALELSLEYLSLVNEALDKKDFQGACEAQKHVVSTLIDAGRSGYLDQAIKLQDKICFDAVLKNTI